MLGAACYVAVPVKRRLLVQALFQVYNAFRFLRQQLLAG